MKNFVGLECRRWMVMSIIHAQIRISLSEIWSIYRTNLVGFPCPARYLFIIRAAVLGTKEVHSRRLSACTLCGRNPLIGRFNYIIFPSEGYISADVKLLSAE